MVSLGRANKRPAIRISVSAGLDRIIDWKHPLLRERKEPALEARLLAAWRKDPGYRFYFDRKHLKKVIAQISAQEWKAYEKTFAYFKKNKKGRYGSKLGAGTVPPRSGEKLKWDCYTPKNQEYAPAVNRFMWIVGMAAVARRSGRVADAEVVFSVMDDWLQQNPVPEDLILGKRSVWPFWYRPWAPFNVACRCKAWLPVLHLLWDSRALTAERFGRYIQALRQHVVYLGRVSTRLDKQAKGNHFLIEMEGMLCGSVFPWVKNQKENWNAAVHNILRCVDKQVLADGVHREVAPGYHRACMNWFNQPLLLARLNNTRIPKEPLKRSLSMLDFGLHAVAPDGTCYRVADAGGQRDNHQAERFLARCSGRTLPVKYPRSMDVLPFLQNTLGANGAGASKNGFKAVQYFPKAGFAAARSSWRRDASAFLMNLNAYGGGHSHADYLSFCYTHKGRTLIDEQGTWAYNNDKKSIDCKLSPAHNVVLLGDRDMFDPGGLNYFDQSRAPNVKVRGIVFYEGKDGTVRTGAKVVFPDGTWWKRELVFDPTGGLRIRDEVSNKKKEKVRIQFYVASAKVKKNADGSVTTHDKGRPNVRIFSRGSHILKTSVTKSYICEGMKELPARLVAFDARPLTKGVWETIVEGV